MSKQELTKLMGLGGLTKDERDEMLAQISHLIFDSALVRTIPLIPEAKLPEFEGLMKSLKDEKVFAFLEKEVPAFEKIVEEEVEFFRSTMTQVMPPLTA